MKPQPMRLGDLSVGFVHSLADAVASHGQDPKPLLEQYGLVGSEMCIRDRLGVLPMAGDSVSQAMDEAH